MKIHRNIPGSFLYISSDDEDAPDSYSLTLEKNGTFYVVYELDNDGEEKHYEEFSSLPDALRGFATRLEEKEKC